MGPVPLLSYPLAPKSRQGLEFRGLRSIVSLIHFLATISSKNRDKATSASWLVARIWSHMLAVSRPDMAMVDGTMDRLDTILLGTIGRYGAVARAETGMPVDTR